MAKELGISENQATSGVAALMPAILGGFKKQTTGAEGLGGLLSKLGGSSLLDDVLSPNPTNVNRGNDILGNIFGSKEVSRTVAHNAASTSGLDPLVLKKMLPMLTMLVTGYMSKQSGGAATTSQGGLLGGLLGGILGKKGAGSKKTGAIPGLFSMFDMDGNGNPLDDILRLANKAKK